MADNIERIAKLESGADAIKEDLNDHETRLRKLERLTFGIIGAALVLSWVITQANNVTKLIN